MTNLVRNLPHPADFPAPPSDVDRARWATADAAARPRGLARLRARLGAQGGGARFGLRPGRLARLRARMAAEGVDAYFGIRPEHMRYLTGFALDDAEDKVAGNSGRF